jgi:hypothetical protein
MSDADPKSASTFSIANQSRGRIQIFAILALPSKPLRQYDGAAPQCPRM